MLEHRVGAARPAAAGPRPRSPAPSSPSLLRRASAVHPRRQQVGHAQHLQRVAGRRGVEDDQVVGAGARHDEVRHPVEDREVGHAGHRGGQLDLAGRLLEDRRAEQRRPSAPSPRPRSAAPRASASISRPISPGRISRSVGPSARFEARPTSSAPDRWTRAATRRPARLAASASAAAQVVLPTPPLPPKNRMRRSRRCRTGQQQEKRGERRAVEPHSPVPQVKLLDEVRIHVEQVQRAGIRQPHQVHEAHQQEEVLEFDGLRPHLPPVAGEGHPFEDVRHVPPEFGSVHAASHRSSQPAVSRLSSVRSSGSCRTACPSGRSSRNPASTIQARTSDSV